MTTTLFTFLGTNPYKLVRYHYRPRDEGAGDGDCREAETTKFIARAIVEIFAVDHVTVVATEKAWDTHGADLCKQLPIRPERCTIPDGRSEDELNEIFRIFIERLEEARSQTGQVETGTDSRAAVDGPPAILIDITHGFRPQSFLAGAVISLMRAVHDDWPRTRILYGAFEAGKKREDGRNTAEHTQNPRPNDGSTQGPSRVPIWDITTFLDMVDWAQALRLFLKTGRAEEAAMRARTLGHTLRKEWAQGGQKGSEPNLKRFADSLMAFSRAFSTVRTGDLLLQSADEKRACRSLADELLHQAKESKEEICHHLPPLATIIDELIAMLQPLSGSPTHLAGPGHADLVAALAALYQRFNRPLQAVSTLREGYINLTASESLAAPGRKGCREHGREKVAKPKLNDLFSHFEEEVGILRNDLLHGGYRENAIRAERIPGKIGEMIATFREDSRDPRLRDLQRNNPPGGIFINLSNHPSADWDDHQRRAAEALGSPIHDIPFPDVPAEADADEIDRMARNLSETILAMNPAAALVQGEFTLAFAMVSRLEAAGVPCYAATTPRLVEVPDTDETDTADRIVRRFLFRCLRRYVLPS